MKKLLLILTMVAGLVRSTLAANVAFAATDIFGASKNAGITLTLLNQPLYYGQALAFGPPQSFCMTNYSLTVSNLTGGSWVMAVQGFPKLFVLNVPPNDTNTWNYTTLINSNTAYYAKLSTVFAYWPSNLDAWALLNPATALASLGTATNLSGSATSQVQTLALQVADPAGTAWTTFAYNATSGVTAFNLAASSGLPISGIVNGGNILTNNYAGNVNLNGTNYLGGNVTEGAYTTASGQDAHAEGSITIASGLSAHAEGSQTVASGFSSHAGGFNAYATNDNTFVWGDGSTPVGSTTNKQLSFEFLNGYRLLGGPISDNTGTFSAATNEATKTAVAAAGYQTAANVSAAISSATNVLTGSNAPTSALTAASFNGAHNGNGGGLTNLQTSAIGGAGDSYSAYLGGTTNQWIDQAATVLTNTTGGIFYSNAALSGSWVAVELTNQINNLLTAFSGITGPKLILATGGINDLSSGGLHNYGQQTSNQVFLAITNIIATVHAKGAKILWCIQPIFGGNPISATTYGTNWYGLCQLLRKLTNGTPNFPSNCVPDYLIDLAAHQDEYDWMPDGHPGIFAEQCFASQALQTLNRQASYLAPNASAVHFTVPNLRATNYTVLDSGSGNWATVIGFGGLLWPVSGHARSQIAPGNQWEWANGSGFMMTLDSTAGNLSINGSYSGNGSGLTNLPASQLTGTLPQSTLPVTFTSVAGLTTNGGIYTAFATNAVTPAGLGAYVTYRPDDNTWRDSQNIIAASTTNQFMVNLYEAGMSGGRGNALYQSIKNFTGAAPLASFTLASGANGQFNTALAGNGWGVFYPQTTASNNTSSVQLYSGLNAPWYPTNWFSAGGKFALVGFTNTLFCFGINAQFAGYPAASSLDFVYDPNTNKTVGQISGTATNDLIACIVSNTTSYYYDTGFVFTNATVSTPVTLQVVIGGGSVWFYTNGAVAVQSSTNLPTSFLPYLISCYQTNLNTVGIGGSTIGLGSLYYGVYWPNRSVKF